MHSFHPSRGRILFEVFCALTISASCVGAWMDLGTLAFLPAAAVSALYAFVHLFDMRGRKLAVAASMADVAVAAEDQGDLLDYVPAPHVEPAVEHADVAASEPEVADLAEPMAEAEPPVAVEPVPEARPRKRKSSRKAAPVAEAEPVEALEPIVEPEPAAEPERPEPVAREEHEDHAPVTPLFEPEPFVRQ